MTDPNEPDYSIKAGEAHTIFEAVSLLMGDVLRLQAEVRELKERVLKLEEEVYPREETDL